MSVNGTARCWFEPCFSAITLSFRNLANCHTDFTILFRSFYALRGGTNARTPDSGLVTGFPGSHPLGYRSSAGGRGSDWCQLLINSVSKRLCTAYRKRLSHLLSVAEPDPAPAPLARAWPASGDGSGAGPARQAFVGQLHDLLGHIRFINLANEAFPQLNSPSSLIKHGKQPMPDPIH